MSSKLPFTRLEDRLLMAVDLPQLFLDGDNGFGMSNSGEYTEISEAGDINGDGLDDLVVLDIFKASVVYGSTNIAFPNLAQQYQNASHVLRLSSQLDGSNGFTVPGYSVGSLDPGSRAAAPLGDFNGDGIDDVAFQHTVFPDSASDTDYSFHIDFLFGSRETTDATVPLIETRDSRFSVDALEVIEDGGETRVGGGGIAGGDINGDGLGDLIIGGSATPSVWVVYGSNSLPDELLLGELDGQNGFEIELPFDFDYSKVSAADVNGDGLDDVLIGSSGLTDYVVFGKAGQLSTVTEADLDGSLGVALSHDTVRSPVPVGDVSGDGIADIAFVGRSDVDVELVLGSTTFDPANSGDEITIQGFRLRDKPGWGLRAMGPGDVNGDGVDDLVIGNPDYSPPGQNVVGEMYVLFGGDKLVRDVGDISPETGFGFIGHDIEFSGGGPTGF